MIMQNEKWYANKNNKKMKKNEIKKKCYNKVATQLIFF